MILSGQEFALPKEACRITTKTLSVYLLGKEDISIIASLWQSLESQIVEPGLTSTWDWVKTWIDHYGDVVEYWFVIGMQDNKPYGVTIITKETHRKLPLPVSAYHIGTAGEPYKERVQMLNNRLLVKAEMKQEFIAAIIETIQSLKWEEIMFDEYNAADAVDILPFFEKQNIQTFVERQLCRQFDFTSIDKNADIVESLGCDTKYSLRRSLKVFNNEVVLETAETAEQALDILDELIILYQKTWQKRGRAGMFASQRFSNFHKTIIRKLFQQKKVLLFRVKNKTYGTLGCVYMLVDNGIAYGCQLGLNDFADITFETINKKRLRTGFIVHTTCMQECMRRGLHAYNFGLGDYPYKRELTNSECEMVTISVRQGIKPLMRDGLIELYARLNKNKSAPLFSRILQKLT